MKGISEEWISYAVTVIPVAAPKVQYQESCRAFFAGAWAALNLVAAIGEEAVTDEQGAAYIESLMQECREFNRDVVGGRA